jgi:hypothetical protein
MILYQQAVSNKTSRLLAKYNIKAIHIPEKKNIHRPLKDKLGLKLTGTYCILCGCIKVYVGQTGRTTETRCKKNVRHVCLGQPEKSAVAEHIFETGCSIDFNSTLLLDKAAKYINCLVMEAITIRLHPRNFKRDGGFNFCWSWCLLTNMIKQYRAAPVQKENQTKKTYK